MAATLTLAPDGRILDASSDALQLLGAGLAELRSLPPGTFGRSTRRCSIVAAAAPMLPAEGLDSGRIIPKPSCALEG